MQGYLHFVREKSLLEAIASSLTELFAPGIISHRVAGMLQHYDFVSREALAYFEHRLHEAPRDSGLRPGLRQATTPTPWRSSTWCKNALRFKCGVLWSQLDALHFAYVQPGVAWPDAFAPDAAQAAA